MSISERRMSSDPLSESVNSLELLRCGKPRVPSLRLSGKLQTGEERAVAV